MVRVNSSKLANFVTALVLSRHFTVVGKLLMFLDIESTLAKPLTPSHTILDHICTLFFVILKIKRKTVSSMLAPAILVIATPKSPLL